MKLKRLTDQKDEARKRIAKRMRDSITFYWCRTCECIYTEKEAEQVGDDYFCPADGSQLEPDKIREHNLDTMGEA